MGLTGSYLTSAQLRGFDRYKYSAMDTSPLSKYVMHPFWNKVVEFFPMWVAPNVLTFTGWVFLMIIFFLLGYYDWDYNTTSNDLGLERQPIPSSVWLLCGFLHFAAHTLDGIDGKQARRTKSSTPLGELFDHGIDSIASILLPICLMSGFGRGNEQWGATVYDGFFPCLAVLGGFFLSHWEKYITGVLYLPWIYDVVQLVCALGYILNGVYGVELWHFYVAPGLKCSILVKWLLILGFFGSIPMTCWNIYDHYTTKSKKRKLGLLAALEPWTPFVLMAFLWTVWVYASPIGILETDPRLFLLTMGIHFSNITCRLIIAQMSNQHCEVFNTLLFPLALGVVLSFCVPSYERLIFFIVAFIITTAHLHYAVSVVNELCVHFKIYCFSLERRN